MGTPDSREGTSSVGSTLVGPVRVSRMQRSSEKASRQFVKRGMAIGIGAVANVVVAS